LYDGLNVFTKNLPRSRVNSRLFDILCTTPAQIRIKSVTRYPLGLRASIPVLSGGHTNESSRYAKFSTQNVPRSAQEFGAGSRLLKVCCIGIRLPFALASAVGTIVLVEHLVHEYGTIRLRRHEFT
jgi:hypothetical protein